MRRARRRKLSAREWGIITSSSAVVRKIAPAEPTKKFARGLTGLTEEDERRRKEEA